MNILRLLFFIPVVYTLNPIQANSSPKCRNCIFFDGKPVYVNNQLISEGRCLKTARVGWKTIDKVPTKITNYDYVESTRIRGICGPNGLLFCDKNDVMRCE